MRQTLVLYSRLAFYPVHWLALEEIVRRYDVRAIVLAAAPPADLPTVHQAHGTADPGASPLPIEVRHVPRESRLTRLRWIASQLRRARPDVIWVQEEPIDPFLLEMLAMYRVRRRPRIVTAVCENIFPRPRRWAERTGRRLLWPRLDHLMTVALPSLEGIRAAGMPESVPASTLVAGGLEPTGEVRPLELPVGFTVGFAGRIVEEKGWRVLAQALPDGSRLVLAGDGPQRSELEAFADGDDRIDYLGLLPKDELWSFYAALDCLAVPSLTTPRWKEQSASTLVDGLCMGLPIVASDSGGIADIMGPAGLLVPEGNPEALREALARLRDDAALRQRLGALGSERFRREFAIPAYAGKIAAALSLHLRSVALGA
ncbi:MAG TPA: glycosyltransferase family 4 protein [Gaiellaceae bacterium]|nr:glycosyltransferase family 4 protein [Gaiellaceae bacterium]